MQKAAQLASVVVVLALLGLLVWKTTHNKTGRLASVVDSGHVYPAYLFSGRRVGAAGTVSLSAPWQGGRPQLRQFYCSGSCSRGAPVVSAVAKRWAAKKVCRRHEDLSGPAASSS